MKRKTANMTPQERLDRIVQLLAKAYLELRYRTRFTSGTGNSCLDVSSKMSLNVPTGEPSQNEFVHKTSRQCAVTPDRLSTQTPFDTEREAHG